MLELTRIRITKGLEKKAACAPGRLEQRARVDWGRLDTDQCLSCSSPAVSSRPPNVPAEAIAEIRTSFRESQKLKSEDNKITLTGSRGEIPGFHAQTGYPEYLKNRDLNQLKELFWLHGSDSGTFAMFRDLNVHEEG